MVAMRMAIPAAIREELSNDPYMAVCVAGIWPTHWCEGKIQWHHAFTYAGKRQNELWSILPLCELHHSKAGTPRINQACKKEMRQRIAKFAAEASFKEKYPKSNLTL